MARPISEGTKNYEEAIAAIIEESKHVGEDIGLTIDQGVHAVDSLLGKVAEKSIDIVQNKLDDITEPEI